MKQVLNYILAVTICFVFILSGVFCGIKWFQKAHASSDVIGQLNVNNNLTLESFSYSNVQNPIVFYHDAYDETDYYYSNAELPAVPSFDGDKKQYQVKLNDYLIIEPTVLYRAVYFRVYINFKDVDSSILCSTYFDVSIKFLSDKTDFIIEAYGDQNRQYIERYIQGNGFELYVNEITEVKKS